MNSVKVEIDQSEDEEDAVEVNPQPAAEGAAPLKRSAQRHSCLECGRMFSRKRFSSTSSFRDHERVHTGAKLHRCRRCPKSFNRPGLLRRHLQTPAEGKEDNGIWSLQNPVSEQNLESEQKGSKKEQETLGSTTEDGMQQDFRLNIKEEEEEEGLNKKDSEDLSTRANHGDQDGSLKTEDVSGLINSDGEEEDWRPLSEQDGGSEAGGSKKKHCCPVCGRDCFKASALQKHLRVHSGERPFKCPTCSKTFTQQVHMTEHRRTHSGEKPFSCGRCGKSFTFSSALRRHQKVHSEVRPFQCPSCLKTFKRQSSLKSHQLTHSGVRFPCPLCSKSFSRALELSYHVDVHADTRPYFCCLCQKDLSGARIFSKHMKKHQEENPVFSKRMKKHQENPVFSKRMTKHQEENPVFSKHMTKHQEGSSDTENLKD